MFFRNLPRISLLILAIFVFVGIVNAQDQEVLTPNPNLQEMPKDDFYKAKVIEIKESGVLDVEGIKNPYQNLVIEILEGQEKGQQIEFSHGGEFRLSENQLLKKGEIFIAMKINRVDGSSTWVFIDKYRINSYLLIGALFFGAIILLARFRGLMSILGLVVSIAIIVLYMVPKIADGGSPLAISLVASLLITFFSIFPSHGFSRRSILSIISILITLFLAAFFSTLFVSMANLTGLGSEQAYYLQLGGENTINLKGLLLAGILIGALGVLDDIATTQVATTEEISRANKKLKFKELYRRGLSVGRSHIVSLVNTLVLAYAGTSLPLMITFSSESVPLWVMLNGEMIGEEIIRTLVGSSALVLAVPISTFIAAISYSRRHAEGALGHDGHYH